MYSIWSLYQQIASSVQLLGDGRSEALLSPHMGYVEEGGRWYEETADSVERWLDGREAVNKINSTRS